MPVLCNNLLNVEVRRYCEKKHTLFSETDFINMLEFLIDNIFVMLGGRGYKLFFVGQKPTKACAVLLFQHADYK